MTPRRRPGDAPTASRSPLRSAQAIASSATPADGPVPDADQLLTQREAAALLRVSVSYLRASDCLKVLLPGRGVRPLVRYRRRELLAWVEHWTARRSTQ